MFERKVSLVLGAGGAKGYAHIGAIKAIEESGYKIVSIAGTSIGSLVGGLYAAGKLRELNGWLQSIDNWKRAFNVVDIKNVSVSGLINGDYIIENLEKILGKNLKLADLKIPFSCVAVDLYSGQEIVFTNNQAVSEGETTDRRIVYIKDVSLLDAIRASISMPAFFIPHEVRGRMCVDGCTSNGLPINHLKRIDGSIVIAINLDSFGDTTVFNIEDISDSSKIFKILTKIVKSSERNNFLSVLLNSYYVALKQNKLLMIEYEKPDVYVNIDLKGFGTFDFVEAKKLHNIGYEQLKEKMEELSFKQRLEVWQNGLLSENGISYSEIKKRCLCDNDLARQDMRRIKALLNGSGIKIEESGTFRKSYRLSQSIDLLSLHAQSQVAVPYRDLIKLLTHSRGLLSNSFFADISSVYDNIISSCETDDKTIEFESNINESIAMSCFSDIYKALRKDVLLITRHHPVNPENTFNVILHPEYLKEYNSEWYVFGNISNSDDEAPQLGRIPLSLIDDVDEPSEQIPFIPTGYTSSDYHQMLGEIIGVELDNNCELETICLRISTKIFHRIVNNPIHHTQKYAPELNTPGNKGIKIRVRRNKELIRTLLNLGSDVEVVSPVKLRNSIKKELNRNLKQYQ